MISCNNNNMHCHGGQQGRDCRSVPNLKYHSDFIHCHRELPKCFKVDNIELVTFIICLFSKYNVIGVFN